MCVCLCVEPALKGGNVFKIPLWLEEMDWYKPRGIQSDVYWGKPQAQNSVKFSRF